MKLTALHSSLLALAALPLAAFPVIAQTHVTESPYGKLPDGQAVTEYTLSDPQLTVKVISYGAHITSVMAPDRTGKRTDIVLGYNSLDGYLGDHNTYMGAIVGRYGNRIANGKFMLDGQTYTLPTNNNGNTLHGGTVGFDQKNWTAKRLGAGAVQFTLVSPDGDQGFPGRLTAVVTYSLERDRLRIQYSATTDKDTVLNLTNHSYFNLAGTGDVLPTKLMINSDKITPVNAGLIPTGGYLNVVPGPFDFLTPHAIGERIDVTAGEAGNQLTLGGGYDHNFVLRGQGMRLAARALDPASGRTLAVFTDQPGVQFYSGNFLDGKQVGRDGAPYTKHDGFCLETQHYPDSPNQPQFPTTELKPGQTFHSETDFVFGTDKVHAQ